MGSKPSAATIVDMLEAAYDLRSFDLPLGGGGDVELQVVFERAVDILADRATDRIRRGLYRRHVTSVEDLFFDHEPEVAPRGFARYFGQDSYLRCSYRSELPGLEDNLILMWALHAASRTALRGTDRRRKVEEAWRTLAGGLAMTEANAETGIERFYDRLAVDERPLHGLCRLVLEHTGQHSGETTGLPVFRLFMPALFAAFVAKWTSAALPSAGTVSLVYEIRIEPDFRVNVEPAVVITAAGAGGSRMIVWPVYDGSALTEAALGRIVARAQAWQAPLAVLACRATPPVPPADRDGIALQTVVVEAGGDWSTACASLLRDIGCTEGGSPLHRPIGRRAIDGTET